MKTPIFDFNHPRFIIHGAASRAMEFLVINEKLPQNNAVDIICKNEDPTVQPTIQDLRVALDMGGTYLRQEIFDAPACLYYSDPANEAPRDYWARWHREHVARGWSDWSREDLLRVFGGMCTTIMTAKIRVQQRGKGSGSNADARLQILGPNPPQNWPTLYQLDQFAGSAYAYSEDVDKDDGDEE